MKAGIVGGQLIPRSQDFARHHSQPNVVMNNRSRLLVPQVGHSEIKKGVTSERTQAPPYRGP
jgi:hypothetical protein